MRSAAALCLAFAASAFAYQVTFPTETKGWTNQGAQTLSWDRVSTDALNFTAVLVNTKDNTVNQVLAAQVDGTQSSTTLNPPSSGWPTGDNYRVNLVQNTTDNAILAQSPEFSINATTSSSSSSSSTASTASGTTLVNTTPASATGGASGTDTSSGAASSPTNNGAASLGAQTGIIGALALVGVFLA